MVVGMEGFLKVCGASHEVFTHLSGSPFSNQLCHTSAQGLACCPAALERPRFLE